MALIECPGCGGKVSDNTDFCSQCGNVIDKASKSKLIRVVAAIIVIPIAFVFISFINGGNVMTFLTQDKSEESQNKVVPILNHKERSLAIGDMMKNKSVVDAAINQDGDELSMLLIVSQGTPVSQAEMLGEQFVLALKSKINDDPKPGVEIGQGIYYYIVGVYTPDQKRIAIASKSQEATHLSW